MTTLDLTKKYLLNLLSSLLNNISTVKECFEEIPTFPGCMSKRSYWYFIDKETAFNTNKVKPFYKKWINILLKINY